MESPVQCPVCTLFLHNGMTLESHLDTHPKDQVIKALCSFTKTSPSCASSRTPTPVLSERSYRSRSRTPVTEDSGTNPWNGKEHDRFWARTPSVTSIRTPSGSSRAPSRTPSSSSRAPSRNCRTPRSHSSTNASRICTPERMVDNLAYEATTASNSSLNSSGHSKPSVIKSDKSQQSPMYQSPASQDYDPQYIDYSEQLEDREVKYSRSAEYNALNANNNELNANNMFSFNVPMPGTGSKLLSLPPHMMPPRKRSESVKAAPTKHNNLLNLVKNNISGMQKVPPYMANRSPYQLVPNAIPTFVQNNVQNSMILASSLPNSQLKIDAKNVPPIVQNHFSMASSAFTPGTTVVTQNSQYFYQEMVQNIDPKVFVPTMPPVFTGHENVTNVAQTSSECTRMYQNVMLMDQYGNTSCMYTPQQVIPKRCAPQLFSETRTRTVNTLMQNSSPIKKDPSKTLIIEVGPILPQQRASSKPSAHTTVITQTRPSVPNVPKICPPKPEAPSISITEKIEKTEAPGTTRGLKILSNIKVEVPVQHIKSMINTLMDLTGSNDAVYPDQSRTPENILPDLELGKPAAGGLNPRSFTELKFENATSSKDLSSKTSIVDNKLETDYGDSCPVPDLICNEKPSISPCSELSESGDNSVDRASPAPALHSSARKDPEVDCRKKAPLKIRLNNIFVRKNKKILQIKNARPTFSQPTFSQCEITPVACSSKSLAPENFAVISQSPNRSEKATLKTISIEEIKESVGYADMEVAMEEVKMPPAPEKTEIAVKEELSLSNDCAFSNEAPGPARGLGSLDPLRPISVSYGSMSSADFDDESSNRELLDLESTKNKQFVTMMNDNYFGDNIYADYFTPEDRGESYDDKGPTVFKDGGKEAFSCSIWGEPSSKGNDFVLPSFIHESYKIADSGVEYADLDVRRDCKGDVPPLNICADERMPPRGELSGQESNGDMESSWNGIYPEAVSTEAYDLMARESWESDGSELDAAEKRENLEEQLSYPKPRKHSCQTCGSKFTSLKELRAHKANEHVSQIAPKQTYSRLLTARSIKKEEKPDLSCAANILAIDSKGSITSTILEVYEQDPIDEAKPKLSNLRSLLTKEVKRKRRDFVCPTCKVNLLTESAFTAHLKIHPLECLTCGKFFTRRANLQLHLKTHLGIKEFKCDVCEKRFTTRQKLGEHQNTHTGRAPYKCTLCDDTFRRYSNMIQHRDRHHFHKRVKTRDFVCNSCGAVFQSRAKFLWHKETHADKPKACLYCSDKFVHAASLTRHVRRSHNELFQNTNNRNKNDNVTCPVCKQVYLRSNLRTHLLTHSGKRPYACVVCNKAFTTKWNLKLHRWVHMSRSAKPFKCTLCKGAFIRQTEYISHMNAHKSVRPYTCNYCGCQFIRKYNCQRHVREHEMAKKFVCNVPECGKSFHRSYYLSEHMKVHSGVRPFLCDICEKTSSNKSNHNKHMKIHHAREMIAAEA